MVSITSRSGPATLIPTGVLMPVASISMRVLIGITHALVRPVYCERNLIQLRTQSTQESCLRRHSLRVV